MSQHLEFENVGFSNFSLCNYSLLYSANISKLFICQPTQSVVNHPPIWSIPLEETFFFCLGFLLTGDFEASLPIPKAQVSQYVSDFWEEIVFRIAFNVPIPFPFCVGETEMVKLWNQQLVQRELGALLTEIPLNTVPFIVINFM